MELKTNLNQDQIYTAIAEFLEKQFKDTRVEIVFITEIDGVPSDRNILWEVGFRTLDKLDKP